MCVCLSVCPSSPIIYSLERPFREPSMRSKFKAPKSPTDIWPVPSFQYPNKWGRMVLKSFLNIFPAHITLCSSVIRIIIVISSARVYIIQVHKVSQFSEQYLPSPPQVLNHEDMNWADQEVKAEGSCGKIKIQTGAVMSMFLVLEAFLFSAE